VSTVVIPAASALAEGVALQVVVGFGIGLFLGLACNLFLRRTARTMLGVALSAGIVYLLFLFVMFGIVPDSALYLLGVVGAATGTLLGFRGKAGPTLTDTRPPA
jgi:hypothetical protein